MQEWKVNDIMQDNRVFSGEGVRVRSTKKMCAMATWRFIFCPILQLFFYDLCGFVNLPVHAI